MILNTYNGGFVKTHEILYVPNKCILGMASPFISNHFRAFQWYSSSDNLDFFPPYEIFDLSMDRFYIHLQSRLFSLFTF